MTCLHTCLHDLPALWTVWREVVRPDAELFESIADGGAVLPRAEAPIEALQAVGLAMVKCVLDDHPIGAGDIACVLPFAARALDVQACARCGVRSGVC